MTREDLTCCKEHHAAIHTALHIFSEMYHSLAYMQRVEGFHFFGSASLAMGVSFGGAVSFCIWKNDGVRSDTQTNSTGGTRKGNGSLPDNRRMKRHSRWQVHYPFRNTGCLCEGVVENRYQVESQQLFPPMETLHASNQSNTGSASSTNKSIDLSNRILLMTNVLSPEECQWLRSDADKLLEGQYNRDLIDDTDDDEEPAVQERSLRRVSLCDMSELSQELSHELIFERILPALRQDNPALLESLGLSNFDGPTNEMDWASDEPSINRYEIGGRFDPHRDGYALTVIVLLSTDGAFHGGGTVFFDSSQAAETFMDGDNNNNNNNDTNANSSVIVKPPQGTAVLFSGDLYHAGRPVTEGTRHLFVASFGPRDDAVMAQQAN